MQHLAFPRPAARRVAVAAARAGQAAARQPARLAHSTRFPAKQGLYDPALEKDSCGVGLVAHLKGVPSRAIVEDAGLALVNMEHRGGCGCDPQSGDGAGIQTALPHEFLTRVARDDMNVTLPAKGEYAAGNIFLPVDEAAAAKAKTILVDAVREQGLEVLGWRKMPTDNSGLGAMSVETEPLIEQIFVGKPPGLAADSFQKELYMARRVAENAAKAAGPALDDFYACSLSDRTITYKGQLTTAQVFEYYKDLQQADYMSHMALVHSRFSTNTFPSWPRAQPNRMLCHNGEINTLRGNKNMLTSREGVAISEYFGDRTPKLFPLASDDHSDSGNFDMCVEMLALAGGRPLHEAVMMMIPEAWERNPELPDWKRDFYEYHACTMEPWDGPAMMAFTDGRFVGANLDRNGLRPCRFYVTKDDHVILASEVGVVAHLKEDQVVRKGRLEPGRMFLIDFEKGGILDDMAVKKEAAEAHPYGAWVRDNMVRLTDWVNAKTASGELPPAPTAAPKMPSTRVLNAAGFTREHLEMILRPMTSGKEPLGSMGVDTPLAVLSMVPRMPAHYFKQLFAQVTNPPIDPIREASVMSLQCPVGPEANLLAVSADAAKRLVVEEPCLSLEAMAAIKGTSHQGWRAAQIDTTFDVAEARANGGAALREAIQRICVEARAAVANGERLVVLSDRAMSQTRIAVPSLLATGAVHQSLIKEKARTKVGLLVDTADAKEVHDFATLVGYGADGVCPYVAYEAIGAMAAEAGMPPSTAMTKYQKAVSFGILKVMSKMGISTVQSYKGAQIFEAVGLGEEVVDTCFTGSTSRLKGVGFDVLMKDALRFHDAAWPAEGRVPDYLNFGDYHWRDGGEAHYNTPAAMVALQLAARTNAREAYAEYSKLIDEANASVTIRGLFKIGNDGLLPEVPLEEVEPASEIVKRFATGAMSLGSISPETHESLAKAMNALGGKSNTGEGGEDPLRFADDRRSAIKQIASGRFGVTSNYLTNADELQIKMAQGAKPGEGGELPGYKVTELIGKTRGTTPGVGLISPPPHHDIYSIEDLAQLIFDLKSANTGARISVKLVSEVGVGVVAAGVAKAKADHIVIAGGDGGTGAAVWTSIKHAGMPVEIGLAEAHQTLVLNGLRSRVFLQSDGQLKSGRDVTVAALLGAEEFGFATAPLIALGCIMMRKCHMNTCPVGIATQDEDLRKKFVGQPEHVMNFLFLIAEEVRGYMAKLGYRKFLDMVGKTERLSVDPSKLNEKSSTLDLSPILMPAQALNPEETMYKIMEQDHGIPDRLDQQLLPQVKAAIDAGSSVKISSEIVNIDRAFGAIISNYVSQKHGEAGMAPGSVQIDLKGHAGQSLGFVLARGITVTLEGDANDYTGKGLSGGDLVVFPSRELGEDYLREAHNHMIVGNTSLYGATDGSAFFRGRAGERFCVRNSGATAVVEGVGDHGCEYMTGGRAVILGPTGNNFAAGMSGGIAYVYDPDNTFERRCNKEMVGLSKVSESEADMAELRGYIEAHAEKTGSVRAQELLATWDDTASKFTKVLPHDYARVMAERAARAALSGAGGSAASQVA